jgi:hypothetical protein
LADNKQDLRPYRWRARLIIYNKNQFQEQVENFYFTNKKFSCNIKILKNNSTPVCQIKIRNGFKTLPIALQRICLRKIFFELTKTQLNYSQIELLRILIQKN